MIHLQSSVFVSKPQASVSQSQIYIDVHEGDSALCGCPPEHLHGPVSSFRMNIHFNIEENSCGFLIIIHDISAHVWYCEPAEKA